MSESRKVQFKEPLFQIRYIEAEWDFYIDDLLGRFSSYFSWADQRRFKDRIARVEEVLEKVLSAEFRLRIYKDRFEDFIIPEHKIITKHLLKEFREQTNLYDPNGD